MVRCLVRGPSSAGSTSPSEDARFKSVIRQVLPSFESAPPVIVIAQKWPCWLPTCLSLGLNVVGGFFPSRYHHHFQVPDTIKLTPTWHTVEQYKLSAPALSECAVLASGSLQFLPTVESLLGVRTGCFLFSVDVFFPRAGLRDSRRLYRSVASRQVRDGYTSAILEHAHYGGATNAVHLLLTKAPNGWVVPSPGPAIRRIVKHYVQAAARGGFPAIDPPVPVPVDSPHSPITVDGLGRIEGLYDVCNPALSYAVPSIFKSTGYVRRRLTPREWLAIHDVPSAMLTTLETDATARGDISLSLPSLVVSSVLSSLWGTFKGGGVDTNNDRGVVPQVQTSQLLHPPNTLSLSHNPMTPEATKPMLVERLVGIKAHHEQAKAAKADDAEVPVYLWNARILGRTATLSETTALEALRRFALCCYRRRIRRDCLRFLLALHGREWTRNSPGVNADREAMREIVWRAANNEWFEYPVGSRLHYFRFPRKYRTLARDGVPNYFKAPGPRQLLPQPTPTLEAIAVLRDKIGKMIKRRYLVPPSMKLHSLIKYFAVPKGEGDWRVVYHTGANGLNDCVWAPSFFLPSVDSLLRIVDQSSVMEDRDIGEMFLNFELHSNTRRFTGIDVRPLGFDKSICSHSWLGWAKNLMGFRSSPYNSVKMYSIIEEVVRGDRADPSNPFQWDCVRLNLPGTAAYNPGESWITKRRKDGTLASDLVVFVDDERVVGSGEERVVSAGHAISTRESYLGLQDALRKLRPATKQPGAWAGVVVHNDPVHGIVVLTSQEKWDRMKAICRHWFGMICDGHTELPFRQLESDRGFLVYVTGAYPSMKPYLKGFHLTLEMWRENRDEEGWKIRSGRKDDREDHELFPEEWITDVDAQGEFVIDKGDVVKERGPASGMTPVAPRMKDDLAALLQMTTSETPVERVVRRKDIVTVLYGFGDASAGGFGSSIGFAEGTHGRFGVWGTDSEDKSSNYRELRNLVDSVEEEACAGRLSHSELWLFTDNSTAEGCFWKGSSTSRLLHDLIVRLRKMEMDVGLKLHVVHVSGTRMIAQGTDGLSRGMLCEGVMAGRDMLDYIDIARTATERHPALKEFIRSWAGVARLDPLTPEEWFVAGHGIIGGEKDQHGIWLPLHAPNGRVYWWDPPPVIGEVALEEALKARHKRNDSTHIFTIPRLCSPSWTRLFYKLSDFVFKLRPGSPHWPAGLHEPLYIGISLPFIRYYPWSLRGTPLLVDLDRELREVLAAGEIDGRDILRKLLRVPRRVSGLSEDMARGVLRMSGKGEVPNVPSDGRRGECLVQPS